METVNLDNVAKPVDFRVSRIAWKLLVFVFRVLFKLSKVMLRVTWRTFRFTLFVLWAFIISGFEPDCCSHRRNR